MINPTNADLQVQIDAIHTRMNTLATSDDIKDMKEFMKKLKFGVGFFTFTWNNAAKIGSIATLFIGIFLFFKFGVMGILAYIFGPKI